ncbi:MAG: flagellar hook protein FlgE [Pseudomonadota bacterium]
MSIYGMMRTSVSGMNAQSSRLGTVAENVANASTIGYKSASSEFSSLIVDSGRNYTPGAIETTTRYGISEQGTLEFSSSALDLAIQGEGMFIVAASDGSVAFTRAGSFIADSNGSLVNAAGFTLMGYPLGEGANTNLVINGTAGLEAINLGGDQLDAVASTEASLRVNVPSEATDVAAGDLPSANAATASYTGKSSVVVYGNLGEEVVLDIYYTKTTTAGEWDIAVFDSADRDPTSGDFPYASAAITTDTLVFDADGNLDASSPTSLSVAVPGGATMTFDLTGTTQLAADYTVLEVDADGNPASGVSGIEISDDGTVYLAYENGTKNPAYKIPLATVVAPDQMRQTAGNTFELTIDAGELRVGEAGTAGFGSVVSGALENSTVDLAGELTEMIAAQRSYTANSKVFQTGSELLDVLVNLKR